MEKMASDSRYKKDTGQTASTAMFRNKKESTATETECGNDLGGGEKFLEIGKSI